LLIPLALLILTTGSSPLGWLGQPKLSDIPKLFLFLTWNTRPGYLIIHPGFHPAPVRPEELASSVSPSSQQRLALHFAPD